MKRSFENSDDDRQDVVQDSQLWTQVVLKRRAAPPLRFNGIMLSRHEHRQMLDHIAIELWRKKSGGFVIGLKANDVEDAASLADMNDAMDWLEDRCAPDDLHMAATQSLGSLLDAPFSLAALRTLRCLAGEAMDAWDQMVAFDEAS